MDFASNHAVRGCMKSYCPAEGSFVLLMEEPCLVYARKELIELLQQKVRTPLLEFVRES